MKQLESAYHIEEDPYSEINLVDLISKGGGERETRLAQSTSFTKSSEYSSSLKHRIEAIKVVNYSAWSVMILYLTCMHGR